MTSSLSSDGSIPLSRHLSGLAAGLLAGATVIRTALREARPISFGGRTVLITGGSRGLGLSMAAEFGRAGARLVLAARDEEELNRARQRLIEEGAVRDGADVLPVVCDLAKPGFARTLIDGATQHFGKVDVLVNNASGIYIGPAEVQPMELYREAVEITYLSAVEAILAVLPQMLERREGSVVNIASIGGKVPVPHLAPYCGAKFALVGFSETLHAEMRGRGVRVTTVIPGLMRTGSFPNATVTGNKKEEYQWFRTGAVTPGLSHSVDAAARKIVRATAHGCAEITIGPETAIASRIHGIAPALSQITASWMGTALLPPPADGGAPQSGRSLHEPMPAVLSPLAEQSMAANNQPPS